MKTILLLLFTTAAFSQGLPLGVTTGDSDFIMPETAEVYKLLTEVTKHYYELDEVSILMPGDVFKTVEQLIIESRAEMAQGILLDPRFKHSEAMRMYLDSVTFEPFNK